MAQITISAPTAQEAVRRLQAFSSAYLEFRNAKVAAQSTFLIDGYQDRLNDLTSDFKNVAAEIQTFKAKGDVGNDEYANALADRSRLSGQISELQAQIQAASLQRDAIVKASQVLDPATPMGAGRVRHAVLVIASGVFAGVAAAVGFVLLQAILSDRLWLRVEVATALRSRVRLSVRRLRPLPRLLRGLPWVRRAEALRARARHVTGDAIATALPGLPRRRSLGVLCLNNSGELAFGVLAAAAGLRGEGHEVALVDLTVKGALQSAGRRSGVLAEEGRQVVRPPVVPSLRNGPGDLDRAAWEELAARPAGLVTLILADVDTAVGLDYLAAWTDEVVVAVTAGRSSVELVRTTGDLVRSAGLTLHGALLLRALRDDVSSGKAVQEGIADVDALGISVGRSQRAERSLLS